MGYCFVIAITILLSLIFVIAKYRLKANVLSTRSRLWVNERVFRASDFPFHKQATFSFKLAEFCFKASLLD